MKRYKKILMLTTLISTSVLGNLGRHDLNWSDYEDFGMNQGKFVAGRTGINVYKKDGTLSGTIDKPMPNFDGVVDAGYLSFWGDPQIMTGVEHVGLAINKTLIKRHMRSDAELSEGFVDGVKKQKTNITEKDKLYNKYSENYVTDYMVDYKDDYANIKNTKIAFDGYITETLQDFSKEVKSGNLIARVGAGTNATATDEGVDLWNGPGSYGRIAGGLNKIGPRNEIWRTGVVNNFTIYINKDNPRTPIDSGTKGGDSGSPVFMWSEAKNKWIIVASNSGGAGRIPSGYGKGSLLRGSVAEVKKYKDAITDEVITDGQNVTIEDSKLKWNGIERDPNREDDVLKNIRTQALVNGKRVVTTVVGKNQIFDTENANINVVGDNNTKATRLEFRKNATISGSGKLETAGFVVEDGVTLTYNMTDTKDNTVRKVGKGTLIMKGTGPNEGELNVGGEGTTILDNENGYAASHIRMALGQKVVLNRENQLKDNNVYFGLRGGTLELKGQNLSFNDIYHIDSGAKIANNEGTGKSNFTFTQGKNRVFLGSFHGNMDVNYNPEEVVDGAKWDLRGNTNITGDLNIEKGHVSISGDNVLHGFDLKVGENEFSKTTLTAENINVKDNTELTVNRASKVNSNINVASNGKLNITATGRVLTEKDEKPDYVDAPKEEDVNKVELEGTIKLAKSTDKNFVANLENNNKAEITSKITGEIKGEKTGAGTLVLKNEDNDVSGTMNITEGKVWADNKETLSDVMNTIGENGILEVDKVSGLSNILTNVDKTSSGILSLGNDVALDEAYKEYDKLFLGSSKNIVIGTEGTPINPNIKILNLGGDGGTVTLKGLEFDDTVETGIERTVNVGKDNSTGTVIIDKLVEKNGKSAVNVNVKNGFNFSINEKITERKFIELAYGASTDYIFEKNISDASEGFLTLKPTDTTAKIIKNTALGAKKGEEVTVNNVATESVYRFSGEGTLNVNVPKLENKDLVVDGQYREGGIINISSDSTDYSGNITVMGNKNDENKGNITLKIGKEGSLGENNNFDIKDGGILDLNGTELKAVLGDNTNENGTITNSSNEKSKLILDIANEKTLVNKFAGNLDIEKNGAGTIEFTNVNNDFGTADNKGKVILNDGKLVHATKEALTENNEIVLNNKTEIIMKENTINAKITANGGTVKVSKNDTGNIIADLELNKNSSINLIEKDDTDDIIDENSLFIGNLKLNSNTLSLNNQEATISDITSKGNIEMTESTLVIDDPNGELLTVDKIDTLQLNGDSNRIDFVNKERDLVVSSNVKGDENSLLEIKKSSKGVTLQNNFKDFNGELYLSNDIAENNKVINYELNSEKEEDRVINYSIAGDGTFNNISKKDLTFKKLNDFSGTLVGENGDIVLDGEDAFVNKTDRAIEEGGTKVVVKNENDVQLVSNSDISVDLLNLTNDGSEANKVVKKGTGNLTLKADESVEVINFKEVSVNEGTLTLEKNVLTEEGKYNLNENSNLKVDFKEENNAKMNVNIGKNANLSYTNSNLHLGNIENAGNIDIINQGLKIENYISKDGLLNIQKDELDDKKVVIDKSEGDINVNLKLSNNVLESLKKKRMTVVETKEKIKIVNLLEYNKNRNYQLVTEHNDIFGIYSVLEPKTLNYLSILNGLNNNYNENEVQYRNRFEVNYVNYNENNKDYENFENTRYKNNVTGNGIELTYEKVEEKGNNKISKGLYVLANKNKVKTDVETQEIFENKYSQVTLKPRIGIKKDFVDISTGVGITKTDMNTGAEVITLNHNTNVGINPKFKIGEDKEITYINNIGYNYNPIIKENISQIEEKIKAIKMKDPINLYYETGINLSTKNVEFMLGGEYRRNLLKLELQNDDEVVENGLKNDWEMLGKARLTLKPKDNLRVNVEIQSKLYQKTKSKQILKTGVEYTW